MPSPDDILEELKLLGVPFSRRGLLRYEDWDVISKAVRGSQGRGIGRYTEYPQCTICEVYAGHRLINGTYGEDSKFKDLGFPKLSPQLVAFLRKNYIDNGLDKERTLQSCSEGDTFKADVLRSFQDLYINLYDVADRKYLLS